jgi:hypothetical protein
MAAATARGTSDACIVAWPSPVRAAVRSKRCDLGHRTKLSIESRGGATNGARLNRRSAPFRCSADNRQTTQTIPVAALATVPLVPVAHCGRNGQVVGSLPVRANWRSSWATPTRNLSAAPSIPSPRATSTPSGSRLDQDAVWYVPGRNQLSGDHRGVDAILGFFAKTMELSGGTFRMEVHDDRTHEDRNVLVIHIRNGKLIETWLMSQDRYAADEFFA